MTVDFSLPELPTGTDPGSRLVLWKAFSPATDDEATDHERPWIRAVMITSVDGTATVNGLSEGLSTPADSVLFTLLRDRADVILVGAATAISEDYGPHRLAPENSRLRQSEPPDIVLLAQTNVRAAIDQCRRRGPRGMAVAATRLGDSDVESARAAGVTLHEIGDDLGAGVRSLLIGIRAREVTFEGGPTLLSAFFAASLLDELVLSFSPQVVFRRDDRRLTADDDHGPVPMRVHSAFSAPDGGLYTRWLVGSEAEQ